MLDKQNCTIETQWHLELTIYPRLALYFILHASVYKCLIIGVPHHVWLNI
jgi:hypothetical protein